MLISQCYFDGPLSSSWALAGPAEANGLPEAHEPLHGPRGHCTPPAPPLNGPDCTVGLRRFNVLKPSAICGCKHFQVF